MKKAEVGSIVLYKEDEEIYSTIITHKTGNKAFRYYGVGQNSFGMILDYEEEQLRIPELNKRLKAVYNSVEDIIKEKNEVKKNEALSVLFYYISYVNERDTTIYKIFKNKGYTAEEMKKIYDNSSEEIKKLFIKNGYQNICSYEETNKIIEDIHSEKELFNFVIHKNNRKNYFNKEIVEKIYKKVNEIVKNEKIKNNILYKLMMVSEKFVNEHTDVTIKRINHFKELNENNKRLFVKRIAPILQGVKGLNFKKVVKTPNEVNEEGKKKIEAIVKTMKTNPEFIKFISDNIEEFFEDIIDNDKEYNIGYYLELENFLNYETIKKLIKKVPVNTILRYENLDKESIEYIVKNGYYNEKFEDGSSATQININRIASRKNTPSFILEKIVEQNKTYLDMDSYGKWDVLEALSNPNINIEFLEKKVTENIDDQVYMLGALQNPNCPKSIKEKIKNKYGNIVKYETSGYIMTYNFEEEEEKLAKQKSKQKTKLTKNG